MSTTRRQVLAALAAAPLLSVRAHGRVQEDGEHEREALPLCATLILVRHTEKDTNDANDPDLSDAGRARAEAFTRMFSKAGVTALVHTEYKRTRDTLAPLARQLEAEPETIEAREMPRLLARLSSAKAGEVIAVAGHSNTIPAIAFAFGVELPDLDETVIGPRQLHGFLPHDAYDRVHVLTPGDEAARLVELRYGEPS